MKKSSGRISKKPKIYGIISLILGIVGILGFFTSLFISKVAMATNESNSALFFALFLLPAFVGIFGIIFAIIQLKKYKTTTSILGIIFNIVAFVGILVLFLAIRSIYVAQQLQIGNAF